MNRGSHIVATANGGPDHGFNEAPIHESGKSAVATASDATRSGFNEAPIHESGKYILAWGSPGVPPKFQ